MRGTPSVSVRLQRITRFHEDRQREHEIQFLASEMGVDLEEIRNAFAVAAENDRRPVPETIEEMAVRLAAELEIPVDELWNEAERVADLRCKARASWRPG